MQSLQDSEDGPQNCVASVEYPLNRHCGSVVRHDLALVGDVCEMPVLSPRSSLLLVFRMSLRVGGVESVTSKERPSGSVVLIVFLHSNL